MYRYLLFLGGAFLVFSSVSCPDECDNEFGLLDVTISAQVDSPQITPYAIGDQIVLSASFPAQQTGVGSDFSISENGGFINTELFRIDPDSSTFTTAIADFTVMATEGELLSLTTADNPGLIALQYTCPDGLCHFSQAFSPDTTGTFLLRLSGGFIDEVGAPFRYCFPPTLRIEELIGGGNLPTDGLVFPLRVDPTSSFFASPVTDNRQENVYYFTVE